MIILDHHIVPTRQRDGSARSESARRRDVRVGGRRFLGFQRRRASWFIDDALSIERLEGIVHCGLFVWLMAVVVHGTGCTHRRREGTRQALANEGRWIVR